VSAAAIVLLVILAALALAAFGPTVATYLRDRSARCARRRRRRAAPRYDPGRERRAERRARELMRSVVGERDFSLYERLGFLRVHAPGRAYGYLIYPHRPIVAYDAATYQPLSEYCVEFPDHGESAHGKRLPDADDVLAKWMSLHGDERALIAGSNMHHVGRQVDPAQVRRDLQRLREWESRTRREPDAIPA
jgi:hypothetical protein